MVIECCDEATAEAVLRAIEVDNEGYVTSERRGSTVVSAMEADSIPRLLQTVDDLLACITVAEKVAQGD
jgi:tRNA threonylcarbamoyladenosine modification (KEOPS) complex  Pcc1 subunit